MTQKTTQQKSYATRSARAVFFWTFFTLTLYDLYWGYRHWKDIGEQENRKTYPVLAALFLPFTLFSLLRNFERIYLKRGVKFHSTVLAIGYGILFLASFMFYWLPTGPYTALLMVAGVTLAAGILSYAQVQLNRAVAAKNQMRPYSAPEVVWIVVGCLLFLPGVVGSAIPQSYYDSLDLYLDNLEVKLDQSSDLEEKANRLNQEYETCFAAAEKFYAELPLELTEEQARQSDDKYAACEDIRLEQNEAADEYNKLIESL